MVRVILGVLVAFLVGCSEAGTGKNQQPSSPATIDVSLLPANISMGDGFPPPAPDLCVWATSVDALVWGRIVDVRHADSPAIDRDYAGWTWAKSCPYGSFPALELEVDIKRSLRGSLTGRIVAHFGSAQVNHLSPIPFRGSGTAIAWQPLLTPTRGPLLAGRPIGLPLQFVPSLGIWSVMGQAMFGTGANGNVMFQECMGPAFEPPPTAAAGMAPGQFDAAVTACTSNPTIAAAAAARRNWILGTWGPGRPPVSNQPPSQYVAATCYEAPEPPSPP